MFLILLRWDRAARKFLGSLEGHGARVVPVLVSAHVPESELPDTLRVVTPESVLTGGDLPL